MKTNFIPSATQNLLSKITISASGFEKPATKTVEAICSNSEKLEKELGVLAQNAKNCVIGPKSLDDALKMTGYWEKTSFIPDSKVIIPRASDAAEQISNYILKNKK